jgi:hypothetical protein
MPPVFTKPMEKTARFQPKFEWPGIADPPVLPPIAVVSQSKPQKARFKSGLTKQLPQWL